MPKNFDIEAQYDANLNRHETASQWAEAELGNLLERESGQYLDKIAEQPEEIANGVERFISNMLGSIAQDKYGDPERAYLMTKTILEYVVDGTFKGRDYRSTSTYPAGGTRHGLEPVTETGIQIGVYHTTEEPRAVDWSKSFGESSMERNEDTLRLLGSLATTLGTEDDINLEFITYLPRNDQPITIAELVTGDKVFAALHPATHDIDIIVRPEDTQEQKAA